MKSCFVWSRFVLVAAMMVMPAAFPVRAEDSPDQEPVVRAVAKVLPAVVNINTERIVRRAVVDPQDLLFYEFYGRLMRPPRELRSKEQGLGSGFIVDPAGYIVTNDHVVKRAADMKIQVTTPDGKTYDAKYVAGDEESDLAFIKIEGDKPFPYVDLEDVSPSLLGQTVIVLGNPLGYGSSVSRGILSATNRSVNVEDHEYDDLIQTDAAINPGNSGGPIIDIGGRLVAISSVKMAYTPQGVPTQGIGFGIPAAKVRDKVREFKKLAETLPAAGENATSLAQVRFGIQLQDLTDNLVRALGYPDRRGVLIADVERGGPAHAAGLQRGLVIYKVGRYEVSSAAEIERLFERARTGTVVDFLVGSAQPVNGRAVREVQTVTLTAR